jgi:hypothetical protein
MAGGKLAGKQLTTPQFLFRKIIPLEEYLRSVSQFENAVPAE